MGRQSILHWIDEIVSYSEQIHEMWKSLPRSRRDAHVFGHSYSELVLPLLRMHQLEDDTERQGSPQQSSNPHILRSEASDSQCISGLPSQLISNSESLRVLILPGCAGNSLKDFLKWYMWEHEGRSVTAFVAILNHFQSDLVRLDDLACGVSSFVDSVTLNDSLLESRVEYVCVFSCIVTRHQEFANIEACFFTDISYSALSLIPAKIRQRQSRAWIPLMAQITVSVAL